MKTFIFVYSPTAFRVSGSFPLRRIDPATSKVYEELPLALDPGTGGTLARGIYGIRSDNDEVAPAIYASTPDRETIDYDLVTMRDKDGWPKPPPKATQLVRIDAAFTTSTVPSLEPALDGFMPLGRDPS